MFYDTETNNHGLPFDPFKSCVVPRPIGWITSYDREGNINLAPYSFFNAVADVPPMIIFSATSRHNDGGLKDTLKNVEETKEFVVNIATWDLCDAINLSSGNFERNINEIEITNLATLPSHYVKAPRIKNSPIHLECIHHQSVQLPVIDDIHINRMVIARVIGIHIDDNIIVDGKIDITLFKPLTRLGYTEYSVIDNKFSMERPDVHNNAAIK